MNFWWVLLFIFLSLLNEFIGVLTKAATGTRRYDGPMGKSDRALILGVTCLLFFFWSGVMVAFNYIFVRDEYFAVVEFNDSNKKWISSGAELIMSVFIKQWEITLVVGLIFGLLVFATILFWILGKVKPQGDFSELKMRTRSWWLMATIFVLATIVHPVITFISLGLLSFFALRELSSISKNVREADRRVLIWCFLSIPVQYYFAYIGHYGLFLTFIPVFMHLWIPFMLVINGETEDISRSDERSADPIDVDSIWR